MASTAKKDISKAEVKNANSSSKDALTQGVGSERILGDNHHTVRDWNRSLILNLIRTRESVSRADLTRLTGLTRGAVSNIVSRLVEEKLVREISLGKSTGGRRPVMLKIAAELNMVGAIDVRPRFTTLAVADLSGHIITRATIPTASSNPEEFLEGCVQQLRKMLVQWSTSHRNVLGIGCVVPGIVSHESRIILQAHELGWYDVSLEQAGRISPWPLILENDANAVALAERYFGNSELGESFVSILLQSDNIGAGLHLKGSLYRGSDGRAGEIAHSVVDPNGHPCNCGGRGCLCTVASTYSIVSRYKVNQHSRRSVVVEPVSNLRSQAQSRAIRLDWSVASDQPRQYHIYRHEASPVPVDAAHQIGIVSKPFFIDHPPEKIAYYYSVVAVDQNDRRSEPSEEVSQKAGTPEVLVQEHFQDVRNLNAYQIEGSHKPMLQGSGLQFGQPGETHASAMVWRETIGDAEVRGRVKPLDAGVYDTCGVLFKVQDAEHWYCAVLAYGNQLRGGETLSLIRQSGEGDEWLAFYSMHIEMGREYEIKVESTHGWIRIKAWPVGEAEPENWQISVRDDAGWDKGGIGFRCYGQRALVKSLYAEQIVPDDTHAQHLSGGFLDYEDPTLQLVLERARQNDLLARRVIDEAGQALALSVYNLSRTLGIYHFHFAGPIIDEGWELVAPSILQRLKELNAHTEQEITISKSTLGREASLLGAVSAASANIFDYQSEFSQSTG